MLVMADKGTEISLGKDGFSFKTDGEASQRLANAALDFLSPITEGAGLLGTKLRGYRMEAALQSTVRAKKICEENCLAINPVPPKFLLQWVEGASLEDTSDVQNLSEMWAQLLANAATVLNKDPNLSIYVGILKKLNAPHLNFFSSLCYDDSNSDLFKEAPSECNENRFKQYITKKYQELGFFETELNLEERLAELVDHISMFFDHPGVQISFGDVTYKNANTYLSNKFNGQINHGLYPEYILDALSSLGLVRTVYLQDYLWTSTLKVTVFFVRMSEFGVNFYSACGGQVSPENSISDKY